jgi:hypothetical protein
LRCEGQRKECEGGEREWNPHGERLTGNCRSGGGAFGALGWVRFLWSLTFWDGGRVRGIAGPESASIGEWRRTDGFVFGPEGDSGGVD